MLAQTTDQLATIFRSEVDDDLKADCGDADCLWSDANVYNYMTEAADAVARAVERNKKTVYVSYLADAAYVRIASSVQHIITARVALSGERVVPMTAEEAYDRFQADSVAVGDPRFYFWEENQRQLQLWPRPAVAGTLALFVETCLGYPLVAGLPLPFSGVPEQRLMLTYMKARAYEKQDAETLDLDRAREFQAQFDKNSADREVEIRKYTRPVGTVQMNW